MRYKRYLKVSIQAFGAQELRGATSDVVRRNRKSAMQYGGRQTGSTYNSAPRWNRNVISKARSRYSKLMNSETPYLISSDATGSRKLQMMAGKPEILISRFRDEIETRSQRLHPGFQGSETQWPQGEYCRCNRNSEIQDGGLRNRK
jgi:hypothetical protein